MELRYKLRISAEGPTSYSLLGESAVLVSSPEPASNVTLSTKDGWHTIDIAKADVYEVEATFLVPLPQTGRDHQRRFDLYMPMALTNNVNLIIPDTNVLVHSPQAVHLDRQVQDNQTLVEAKFAPGQLASFTWQPKERQASQEEVQFFARDTALAYVTSGLLEVSHVVRLQIAQGQVEKLKLRIADGETVTAVNAPDVGGWQFDPVSHEVEVRLTRPVTGVYEVMLVTQSSSASVPYTINLKPLVVQDALEQHNIMGLAADSSVYVRLDKQPAAMNVRDFIRDSGRLLDKIQERGLAVEQITQAFRFSSPDGIVSGQVLAVQSELRSRETARFNAEDDRLVYNSQWIIEIAKAGRFDVVLQIPEGYDIDTLVAEEVSHWDETNDIGKRNVHVHFKRKLTGLIPLNLTLSQPISQMPESLTAPRVTLADALKHTGQLIISSEQGVRLSVQSRQGISEVNPAELGQPGQDLLAFRLLRPDWQLDLQTELVQPRITVQSLHVAKVTDGLVRHDHYLRYKLFHAGAKTFELELPQDAAGVTITGPRIARLEQSPSGIWRVELADKVLERPYLLRLTYETQYKPTEGAVSLAPVRCKDVDLQQGYAVVFATDRMELSADSPDMSLRQDEARNIPKYFGAGDLSGAVMCYSYSALPDNMLTITAKRHAAAEQIGADVRKTELSTVITPSGQAIHRATLTLGVGTQRHLQVILPTGGEIWSLSVDGQATQPSIRSDDQGQGVLRVPLPQQTENVVLDMVYVAKLPSAQPQTGAGNWAGDHRLSGAKFDLPLKRISWQVFVPEGFNYDDFDGTLTYDKNRTEVDQDFHSFNLQFYENQIREENKRNDREAMAQQALSREFAQQGRQDEARRALSIGYNVSKGNIALNEDIQVDLNNLLKQQAKMGLVSRRGRLRNQIPGAANNSELIDVDAVNNISFTQQQADQVESSLGKADSDNLELITQRIIQTQAAAKGSVAQLQITMPTSGKVLRFESPLQVEPEAEMTVTFKAKRQKIRQVDSGIYYGFGLFVGLLVVGGLARFVQLRWNLLHAVLTPKPRPAQPVQTQPVVEPLPQDPDDTDEPDDHVSADELI